MPRGATLRTGDRPPPGVSLTCTFAPPSPETPSGAEHPGLHDHTPQRPDYACRHHSIRVLGSMVLGLGTASLRPLPLRWLHHRQVIRVLSSVSVPPRECGMMWSTSALFGRREYS